MAGVDARTIQELGRWSNLAMVQGYDNDNTQNRFTGFAVANPSNENSNVTLYVLDENGGMTDVLSPPELNPLGPLK